MEQKHVPSQETVKAVFSNFTKKLTTLQSYFNINKNLRDDTIQTLMEEIKSIEKSFLRDWHSTEAYQKIIQEYEDYFETFGFNIKPVKDKISSDKEIQFHLQEAMRYHEEIESTLDEIDEMEE